MPNDESINERKDDVKDVQKDGERDANIATKLQDDSQGALPRESTERKNSAVEQLPSLTLINKDAPGGNHLPETSDTGKSKFPREPKEHEREKESGKTEESGKPKFPREPKAPDQAPDSADAKDATDATDADKDPDQREKETLDGLRDLIDKKAEEDLFSGAVIVAKDGVPILAETRGLADRETGEPVTLDTKFRIASMGKMFTALATMKLVEDGKVNLDDTLDKYLPDYPNKEVSSKVTIRQLLNHSSGLGDIFTDEYTKDPNKFKEIDDYIKANAAADPKFEPGKGFNYSNYGYVLLGAVIEKASGKSYEDFVKENIFDRAGMKDTGMRPEHEHVEGRSKGYTAAEPGKDGAHGEGPPWKSNSDSLPYKPTSAGGSYSTARDLLAFANALKDNKLISEETKKLMTTPSNGPYAFGSAERTNNDGEKSYGHAGGAEGMSSDLQIFEKSGYIVISLSNMDPPAAMWMSDYASKRLPSRKN